MVGCIGSWMEGPEGLVQDLVAVYCTDIGGLTDVFEAFEIG
mgnify:CR=1 FL=1